MFGTWLYNRKTKRRRYISLNGKCFIGSDAVRKAKEDKESLLNPQRTIRAEFSSLVNRFCSSETVISNLKSELDVKIKLLELYSWGFPKAVINRYFNMKKVSKLFQWQVDCLTVDNGIVLKGRNLVYSAPTSGGKTLVAEILMLRKFVEHRQLSESSNAPFMSGAEPTAPVNTVGVILFVVPFVALAEEKALYFQDAWQDLNLGNFSRYIYSFLALSCSPSVRH